MYHCVNKSTKVQSTKVQFTVQFTDSGVYKFTLDSKVANIIEN